MTQNGMRRISLAGVCLREAWVVGLRVGNIGKVRSSGRWARADMGLRCDAYLNDEEIQQNQQVK